ncbi:uncharacterized protein LOC141718290 [Apium graveolens]|uniref:uncharacterized protein LOC141718290 n=1 Tax=Apium graveolens TaxID=4045 RepID=UPI003D7A5FAD
MERLSQIMMNVDLIKDLSYEEFSVAVKQSSNAVRRGRNISDNILVAFEVLHYMKRKNSGSDDEVALKLGVSKAYGRVDSNFLKNRVQRMGFSSKCIQWMLLCVTTVSYSLCFNGSNIESVTPKRGLRQGDHLPPYLFLLCVEGLQEKKLWLLRNFLNGYEKQSGQSIYFSKSGIYFSVNVRLDKQEKLKDILLLGEMSCGDLTLLILSFLLYFRQGRMGFINLHGFNLALLGKHCWNFVNRQNALVSRVFKARYFLSTNFFQAKREGGPSFIWSSIWKAKEELKNGVLGDVQKIKAFKDCWLRDKHDFRVDLDHLNVLRSDRV